MNYRIYFPDKITAVITLPASKSISNRALIINALSGAENQIENVSKCDDTDAMLAALTNLDNNINIGAAGTAMRFLTGYFAMQNGKTTILDGSERMRHRPVKILADALRRCGAEIEYLGEEGFPPLKISGKNLEYPSVLEIPGNISSQYISSLLMIAPMMKNGLTISLTGTMMSVPYIDMTLAIMRRFGITGTRKENIISIPHGKYTPARFAVENDWSGASYWYEIAALLPESQITLTGLNKESVQGDSAVSRYFEQLGVATEYREGNVILRGGNPKTDFLDISLIEQPDLAQTVVVTAAMLNIPFKISGLATLKIKETDRIEALRSQLAKFGYNIEVDSDFALCWNGNAGGVKKNISIDTFEDHRMAMAFAPTAIKFPNIVINNIEVVSKSYPDFWEHLKSCGVHLNCK